DVCKPFTVAHGALWGGMALLTILSVVCLGDLLGVVRLDLKGILILVVFLLLVVQTLHTIERALTWLDRAGQELCRRLPRRKTEENT
ncbi:MAG: hypothetical protein SPK62_07365, partial [Gemmiger sp.]